MKLILILFIFSLSSFASTDLNKRPKAFAYKGSLAVFADFTQALHEITYDVTQKKAYIRSTITLTTAEAGHLVFDLHTDPTQVSIDGLATTAGLISTPDKETSVRVLSKKVAAGAHKLKIQAPLTQLVEFSETGVKSAFWMSDLTDRGYLERYLPTNFIFDRIPMTFLVQFLGATEPQRIYANGNIEDLGKNIFRVTYRKNLNTTSQYFHTVPQSAVVETRFNYKSLDGRELPTVIYFAKQAADQNAALEDAKARTLKVLDELEKDYGPFPHPSLTMYIQGPGGMEYAGATMTGLGALGHELTHSYFARGVMPSDGNAGWIDEALACWRDNGYKTITELVGTSQMAGHGVYARATDKLAYSFGERFMALLDGKLQEKGGLKIFLRELVEKRSFDPLSVLDFNQAMNKFYSLNLDALFKQYLYTAPTLKSRPTHSYSNDVHRQLSISELKELL